jgi:hypothetical protein
MTAPKVPPCPHSADTAAAPPFPPNTAGLRPYQIPDLQTSGSERQRDGILVTLREQTSGHLKTVHETGPTREALERVCDYTESLEGDWKIVSVSTPGSIFRDLQGRRGQHEDARHEKNGGFSDPRTTEWNSLGRIGRLYLLQPLRQAGHDRGAGRIA